MPELAEVEFYRRIWNQGLGQRVSGVDLHGAKRIFRGIDPDELRLALVGSVMEESFRHGKQMLFRFSRGWVGIHLGMTGELRAEPDGFVPGKHDHLVLRLTDRSLVFADHRLFGRVLFHPDQTAPTWWTALPQDIETAGLNPELVATVLKRRKRAPIKAVLLMQAFFPGIGNWMADEILWRSRMHPATVSGSISAVGIKKLSRQIAAVVTTALETIATARGPDFGEPPPGWLFHERWGKNGTCPRCRTRLHRDQIGGRTTAWCPRCQPSPR